MGCGKGRAVCYFARQQIRKVVGVEISEQLCKDAEVNVQNLRGRQSQVEILNTDAAIADVSEGTVFFMSNPFGEQTLREMIGNIQHSLEVRRGPIRIIYVRPLHENVLREFSGLFKAYEYKRLSGQKVVIYSSDKNDKDVR